MLAYLEVSDFALIENIQIELHPGLNVLTGETGAGKTVLVGAIGLLLGDRADSMQVRHGADASKFSAVFDLSALPQVTEELERFGYVDKGESDLLLGRSVTREGKSRCTINGRLCPVSALSEIGALLVEVHGQNDHQALLNVGTHLEYLDRFAGESHLKKLGQYREHFSHLRSLVSERREIRGEGRDLEREAELLAHEIESIDKTDTRPGEIEELEADAVRMRHAKELWEFAARAEELLTGDEGSSFTARELLTQAANHLRRMASHDKGLVAQAERLEALVLEVEDVSSEVAVYREALDTDPSLLEEVESRLGLLRDLCRRYGDTLDAVLEYRAGAADELKRLEEMGNRVVVIDSEIDAERSQVAALAGQLADVRTKAARALEKAVSKEMAQLELGAARLEVRVREREAGEGGGDTSPYGPHGVSDVEFLFSPDEKEPVRPLKRIASGGEMSRVMLALKIVLADADRLPVLIFDEVDAGIGGETAGKVGEKLQQLTGYHQVFCVTHIPQIATFADWQYRVYKSMTGEKTRTLVSLLDSDGRIEEMCRMLGDSSGRRVTKEHARDILKRAREMKSET